MGRGRSILVREIEKLTRSSESMISLPSPRSGDRECFLSHEVLDQVVKTKEGLPAIVPGCSAGVFTFRVSTPSECPTFARCVRPVFNQMSGCSRGLVTVWRVVGLHVNEIVISSSSVRQ